MTQNAARFQDAMGFSGSLGRIGARIGNDLRIRQRLAGIG